MCIMITPTHTLDKTAFCSLESEIFMLATSPRNSMKYYEEKFTRVADTRSALFHLNHLALLSLALLN